MRTRVGARCWSGSATSGIDPRAPGPRAAPAAQQVVSIARALSHDVRLLIMDEPSAILDEGEIETLFEVVRRLTAEGVGVVYITHRLDEIRRIGDRVTVLTDGAHRRHRDPGLDPHRRAGRADGRPQGRAALPRARRRHGQGAARGPRPAPAARGPRRQLRGPRRRGARPRRAGRLRAQRAAAADLRHRRPGGGRGAGRGQAPAAQPARPRDRRRARARPRGPQVAGAAARVEPDQERQPRRPGPLRPSAAQRARRAQPPPPSSCGRSTPFPTIPTGSFASSPAATSRRSSSRAGCCASAACCCSTSRPAAWTSRPRPSSTG